jgi:tyrosyl-tRNA synthetase
MMGQTPQQCFLMPILVGTDGVRKMSKSLGNYVAVEDPPDEMFGKLMSLSDDLIIPYFDYLTDASDTELAGMAQELAANAVNPMHLKKRLAFEITAQFHGLAHGNAALAHFERVVQRGDLPDEMPEVAIAQFVKDSSQTEPPRWSKRLVEFGLAGSASEAKRLIGQKAVEIIKPSGESLILESDLPATDSGPGDIIKVGKRRFVRLVSR